MRWLPGGIAFLAVLVLVPAAGAAQRYASPVGVGPPPCVYKPVKGAFSASGAAGANSFKFSGRVGGKALRPGAYRLTGSAGGASKSAGFEVAK